MKFVGALLAVLPAFGCTCGTPSPAPLRAAPSVTHAEGDPGSGPTAPMSTTLPVEASRVALPRSTRSDLPPELPALRVTIDATGTTLDNGAQLGAWPPADRERVALQRPPGDAEWPAVHAEVGDGSGPGMRLAGLSEAFARATAVERARAGDRHTPTVYALHVEAEVPYQRVAQVLFTAALEGWSEPRFVMRAPAPGPSTSTVWLAVPLAGGAEPPAGLPAQPTLSVSITTDRHVRVGIGPRPLDSSCDRIAEAPVDTLPDLDAAAFTRCVDAALRAGLLFEGATLTAPGDLPAQGLLQLLEALQARVPRVALAIPVGGTGT